MVPPALPPLPRNFHDGEITAVVLGPRRELTLSIAVALLPPGRTAGAMPWYDFTARFGGITNYEAVRAFFQSMPGVSRIGLLDYANDEVSRVHRLVFRLTMDDARELRIRCRNLSVWQNGPGGDQ